MSMSIVTLYLGGTDTVSNTIRWLLLNLARRPEVQARCADELSRVFDDCGELVPEECHFFNAVLLENRRLYPVADTLPHQTSNRIQIRNHTFEKGTVFMGMVQENEQP